MYISIRTRPQDMVSQLSAHCKANKCFLVHDRLHGGLDCRRMIDITMNCIREARMHAAQAGKQYRYFLLLSGQDYPIVPAAQIEEQLSRIYPAPILDCTKAECGNWVAKKFERNRYLIHYRDFVLNRSRGPCVSCCRPLASCSGWCSGYAAPRPCSE